jgi:hypothetical protein
MKDIINPWVIGGAVVIASILLVLSFYAAGGLLPPATGSYAGGANITVIPLPTFTNTPIPTAAPATPTEETFEQIQQGGFAQISGTEGEGLRLRRDPSLNGEIIYLGLEGEIFQVVGGPEEQDGYLWWKLTAPLNESRSGWAVSNYLEPVQGP